MVEELTLSVELETSPGVWLELEDPANGYEVGGGSFASAQTTSLTRNVGEEVMWVAGSGVAVATKVQDITEALEVWVTAADPLEFDTRVKVITDVLAGLGYRVRRTIGNSRVTWTCKPANFSVETQREYIHATTGLIRASVPRLPTVVLEEAP